MNTMEIKQIINSDKIKSNLVVVKSMIKYDEISSKMHFR